MKRMHDNESILGWCPGCAAEREATPESDERLMICDVCGERMKPTNQITQSDREAARFMDWMRQVSLDGKWGPSPGGASAELHCSRAMVDDLVAGGVLERTEYDADGHKVVMISARSIEQAKRNKDITGRWTGKPGQKFEYGKGSSDGSNGG